MRFFWLFDFRLRRRQLFEQCGHSIMGFAHAGGKTGLVGAERIDLLVHLGFLRIDLLMHLGPLCFDLLAQLGILRFDLLAQLGILLTQ